jgi:hypothetical protein
VWWWCLAGYHAEGLEGADLAGFAVYHQLGSPTGGAADVQRLLRTQLPASSSSGEGGANLLLPSAPAEPEPEPESCGGRAQPTGSSERPRGGEGVGAGGAGWRGGAGLAGGWKGGLIVASLEAAAEGEALGLELEAASVRAPVRIRAVAAGSAAARVRPPLEAGLQVSHDGWPLRRRARPSLASAIGFYPPRRAIDSRSWRSSSASGGSRWAAARSGRYNAASGPSRGRWCWPSAHAPTWVKWVKWVKIRRGGRRRVGRRALPSRSRCGSHPLHPLHPPHFCGLWRQQLLPMAPPPPTVDRVWLHQAWWGLEKECR